VSADWDDALQQYAAAGYNGAGRGERTAEQMNQQTIRSVIAAAEQRLAAGPHPDRARRDAEGLMLLTLRVNAPALKKAWLIAHEDETVSPETFAVLERMVAHRLVGEPMQYLAGEVEFYGLPFSVSRDVLIPRPETEHLIEKVVELAKQFRRPKIVDVGTGSGAIAVALAHKLPDAEIYATDLSEPTLAVGRRNAERNGVNDRVRFLEGDLLKPVVGQQFHIVVSNPPYVPERDRASLSVEVRDFEPALALFAGDDGLDVYRRLIPAAFGALNAGGYVALEIGYGQSDAVKALLVEAGFIDIEFAADLQGILRVVTAQRP
jgi:release factor glutamine methyltransferase